jgi:alkanesulfonate monooxygenase SsuD/methylene tetrahydromethanopterin reductase-like flavin-dependent oxidoreductase (luciferase family)
LIGGEDRFPRDVMELQDYLGPPHAEQRVHAIPGQGSNIPLWILGSSTYGAELAAAFGLPYAFASHFAPQMMMRAIEVYRANFRPSAQLESLISCSASTSMRPTAMRKRASSRHR